MTKKLPVLEAMSDALTSAGVPNIKNVLFVCVQHLLHTSVDLFAALIDLGAEPSNIFLLGKHYSECHAVNEKMRNLGIQLQNLTPLKKLGEYTPVFNHDVSVMWENVQEHIRNNNIEAVVVLDDGGRCLEFIAKGILDTLPVIGIEQTTAGLFNPALLSLHVPFIDVASCAAKTCLESEVIAEAILNKISKILPLQNDRLVCGVVGVGTIGKAVAKKLVCQGYEVLLYDQDKKITHNIPQAKWVGGLEQLILEADFIFGCTGRDVTAKMDIQALINKNKTFISCTSEDKEFLTLLHFIQNATDSVVRNPLDDIHWIHPNNSTISIHKGGFPVNFDHSGESVSAENIQLTRGLLLGAMFQAIAMLPNMNLIEQEMKGRVMLFSEIQKFVVMEWSASNGSNLLSLKKMMAKFYDSNWIIEQSNGSKLESRYLMDCFSRSFLSNVAL